MPPRLFVSQLEEFRRTDRRTAGYGPTVRQSVCPTVFRLEEAEKAVGLSTKGTRNVGRAARPVRSSVSRLLLERRLPPRARWWDTRRRRRRRAPLHRGGTHRSGPGTSPRGPAARCGERLARRETHASHKAPWLAPGGSGTSARRSRRRRPKAPQPQRYRARKRARWSAGPFATNMVCDGACSNRGLSPRLCHGARHANLFAEAAMLPLAGGE